MKGTWHESTFVRCQFVCSRYLPPRFGCFIFFYTKRLPLCFVFASYNECAIISRFCHQNNRESKSSLQIVRDFRYRPGHRVDRRVCCCEPVLVACSEKWHGARRRLEVRLCPCRCRNGLGTISLSTFQSINISGLSNTPLSSSTVTPTVWAAKHQRQRFVFANTGSTHEDIAHFFNRDGSWTFHCYKDTTGSASVPNAPLTCFEM